MRIFVWHALGLCAFLAGVASPARAIDTNIRSYICQKLDDFTATMSIVRVDHRELGKISKDIGILYRLNDVQMKYKEPNMIRMEGSLEGAKGIYVMNDATQYVSVPRLNIKTRRNYDNQPGKKKTLIDVGLVSEFYLTYTDAKFERESSVDGVECAVFDLAFKNRKSDDQSHQRVFIDPRTRVIRKREAYTREGKLQAIYHFKDPVEVKPGIWFPSRIEAVNTDRVVAGVTAYKDIKVNTGLPDSIFKL